MGMVMGWAGCGAAGFFEGTAPCSIGMVMPSIGLAAGFLVGAFFVPATFFLGAVFLAEVFFAAGFFFSGMGMVMPGMCICAAASPGKTRPNALAAASHPNFT